MGLVLTTLLLILFVKARRITQAKSQPPPSHNTYTAATTTIQSLIARKRFGREVVVQDDFVDESLLQDYAEPETIVVTPRRSSRRSRPKSQN